MANEGIISRYIYAIIVHAVTLTLPAMTLSNFTTPVSSTLQSSSVAISIAPNQSNITAYRTTLESSSISFTMLSLMASMTLPMSSSGITATAPLTSRTSTFSMVMSSTFPLVTRVKSHSSVSTTPTKFPTTNAPKKEAGHVHNETTEGKVVIWILLAICAACLVVLAAHLFLVIVSDQN